MPETKETLVFNVTNVTGTREITFEAERGLPAETVAHSVASLMALPDNVPWVLRDDSSSAFLDDRTPIGEQIAPGTSVTVTPKTHLG